MLIGIDEDKASLDEDVESVAELDELASLVELGAEFALGGGDVVLGAAFDDDGEGVDEGVDELLPTATCCFCATEGAAAILTDETGELLDLSDLSEPESPPALLRPPSNITKFALTPSGTVTTQKLAPPAPSLLLPTISLILFWDGSIAHGSPLHPSPSQTISTPHLGMTSRNGVAGSRYMGFQASFTNVLPL